MTSSETLRRHGYAAGGRAEDAPPLYETGVDPEEALPPTLAYRPPTGCATASQEEKI